MTLGKKSTGIRNTRAFSLEGLAKKTNLTRSFLSQIGKDGASPAISSLMKIAGAFGIRIGGLFLAKKSRENYTIHEHEGKSYVIGKKLKVESLAPREKDLKFEPGSVHIGIGGGPAGISLLLPPTFVSPWKGRWNCPSARKSMC